MIRARVVLAAVATEIALTVLIARLVGTPVVWSALVALPVAALLLLLLISPPGVEPSWQAPPSGPASTSYLEASTLASRLTDAAADRYRFRTRIQPRLASVALASLRTRPGLADLVDLTDERAVAALGPRWHALLTTPSATLPEPSVLLEFLDHLERP